MDEVIGVVGFGRMGSQIVTELLILDRKVILYSVTNKSREKVDETLFRNFVKRHVTEDHAKYLLNRLLLCDDPIELKSVN